MSKVIYKRWKGLQTDSREQARIAIGKERIHISSKIDLPEQKEEVSYNLMLHHDWTLLEFRIWGTNLVEQVFTYAQSATRFVNFDITPLTKALPINYLKFHHKTSLEDKILLIQYPSLHHAFHEQSY